MPEQSYREALLSTARSTPWAMRAMTHASHDETQWLNCAGDYLFPLPVSPRAIANGETEPNAASVVGANPLQARETGGDASPIAALKTVPESSSIATLNAKNAADGRSDAERVPPNASLTSVSPSGECDRQETDGFAEAKESPDAPSLNVNPAKIAVLDSLLNGSHAAGDVPYDRRADAPPLAVDEDALTTLSTLLEGAKITSPPGKIGNGTIGQPNTVKPNKIEESTFRSEGAWRSNDSGTQSEHACIVGFPDPMSACLFRQSLITLLQPNTGKPFLPESVFPLSKMPRSVVYLSALACPKASAQGGPVDVSAWAVASLGRLGHVPRNLGEHSAPGNKAEPTAEAPAAYTDSASEPSPANNPLSSICDPPHKDDYAKVTFVLDATSCPSDLTCDLENALKDIMLDTSGFGIAAKTLIVLVDDQIIDDATKRTSIDEWSDRIAVIWNDASESLEAGPRRSACIVHPPQTTEQFKTFLQQWWLWFGYDAAADTLWLYDAVKTTLPKLGFDFYRDGLSDSPNVLRLFTAPKPIGRPNILDDQRLSRSLLVNSRFQYPDLGLLCSLLTMLRDGFRIESSDELLRSISYQRRASDNVLLEDIVDAILECLVDAPELSARAAEKGVTTLEFSKFLALLETRHAYDQREIRHMLFAHPLTASLFSRHKNRDGDEVMILRLSGLLSCLLSKRIFDTGSEAADPIEHIVVALLELSRKLPYSDWLLLFHETVTSSNARTESPLLAQALIERAYEAVSDDSHRSEPKPFCGRDLKRAQIGIIQISLGMQLSLMGVSLKAWDDFFLSVGASTDHVKALSGARARGRLNPDNVFVLRNAARRKVLDAYDKAVSGERSQCVASGEAMGAAWIELITLDPNTTDAGLILDSIREGLASSNELDCAHAIALFECLSWAYDMKVPLPFDITAYDILESPAAQDVTAFVVETLAGNGHAYLSCARVFWFYAFSHDCLISRRAFERIVHTAIENLVSSELDSKDRLCPMEVLAWCAVMRNRTIEVIPFASWKPCLANALAADNSEESLHCMIAGWGMGIVPDYFLDAFIECIDFPSFSSPNSRLMSLFSALVNLRTKYNKHVFSFAEADAHDATSAEKNDVAYMLDHGYGDRTSRARLNAEELLLSAAARIPDSEPTPDPEAPWASVVQIDISPFINLILHYAIVENKWDRAHRAWTHLKDKVDTSSAAKALEFWGQLANQNTCEGLLVKILLHHLGIACFTELVIDDEIKGALQQSIATFKEFTPKPGISEAIPYERAVELTAIYYDVDLKLDECGTLCIDGVPW